MLHSAVPSLGAGLAHSERTQYAEWSMRLRFPRQLGAGPASALNIAQIEGRRFDFSG